MRLRLTSLAMLFSIALAACAGTSNTGTAPVACGVDCLDKEKVELQSCLGHFDGTQIERRECSICIIIGCDSLFESNSDRIRPASGCEIEKVADVLKRYPETRIKVEVHTDCIRSEEENLSLSELQAWSIKKVLVDKGVAPSLVTARGWGESKPVASNADEAGRKMNRRVSIILTPS